MRLSTGFIDTPCGRLKAASDEGLLVYLDFDLPGRWEAFCARTGPVESTAQPEAIFAQAQQQLEEYFAGKRTQFDLPVRLTGSAFQQLVWSKLSGIPFGTTINYLQLALQCGDKTLTRAVARANSENSLAILVPCHRVIGADGGLRGYSGGLENKNRLLSHEASVAGFGAGTLFGGQ